MKIKHLLCCCIAVCLASACNRNGESFPEPVRPKPVQSVGHILMGTAVTNAEGNSGRCYLQLIPDLHQAAYDNRKGIPVGFGTTPIALPNGHIYALPDYMGNSKAELKRYSIGPDNQLKLEGSMPLPAGGGACNIVELNDTKAYVTCQTLGQILIFNPMTMKQLGKIDLSVLSHDKTKSSPSTMIIRDGWLFVGLSQYNAQWMPEENSVELALIDTRTDKYVKTIRNSTFGVSSPTRPIDPNSVFMDEHGDIYLNCIGSFGLKPGFPGGIIRIRKGETEIDPTYCIRLDRTEIAGLSTRHAEFLGAVCYDKDGKLYAYANSYALDPAGSSNPYMSKSNVPVVIDLNAKTIKVVAGFPASNPFGIAIGKYKGHIIFGSANTQTNGFYSYDPDTEKVTGPVITVQGFPWYFYGYDK